MKVRTDFVTNSSSSSFVAMRIENPLLAEILEPYKDCFDDRMSLNGNVLFAVEDECAWVSETPKNLSESTTLLIALLSDYFEQLDLEDDLEEFIDNLEERAEELKNATEDVSWDYGSSGYGGDDETRYWRDYSDEEVESWYEYIAKEKGCSIEEVNRDDFQKYVVDQSTGHNEYGNYSYSKNGKETYNYDFELII